MPTTMRRLAAAALSTLTAATICATAINPAQAAGPRPLFQLPFPCGESWRLSTYAGHDDFDIDMIANSGTTNNRPILASYGGRVVRSGWDSGGGNYVRIDHGNGWQTLYLHMIAPPPVSVGQVVTRGQLIGRVGSTGNSSGPHLHYEQLRDGAKVESWFNGVPSGITTDGHPAGEPQSPPRNVTSANCKDEPPDTSSSIHMADYDGDGKSDLAFYRPTTGTWWLHDTNDDPIHGSGTQYGGQTGDTPVPGDYDGDGKSDFAFYRPSNGTWWIHDTNDDPVKGTGTQYGGQTGDIPVPGDYDGDGKSDFAFFRPSSGTWWIHDTNDDPVKGTGTQYGQAGDIPVPGDYDGDGKSDFALYRPSTGTWWIHDTNDDPVKGTGTQYGGQTGDTPAPGDYDGDGKSDLAFYRPSNGTWWIHDTNDDPVKGTGTQYGGQTGDTPTTQLTFTLIN